MWFLLCIDQALPPRLGDLFFCVLLGEEITVLLVDSTNLLGKKIPGEENVFYEPAFYENDMGRKYMGKKLQGSKIPVLKFILRKY